MVVFNGNAIRTIKTNCNERLKSYKAEKIFVVCKYVHTRKYT